jgi:CRP/FNR family transcriptional regulator, cyclic AMP receptor protein
MKAVLNLLGPGDLNGEIALLDGGERTSTATALVSTKALLLFRRDLLAILREHPDSLMGIIVSLCAKLRQTSLIVETAHGSVQARLAGALARLIAQHGRATADGIIIDLLINQRDLGNYAGVSRENTSRELSALKRARIIATKNRKIIVQDIVSLNALAGKE